jgi:HlyD family secretion protein
VSYIPQQAPLWLRTDVRRTSLAGALGLLVLLGVLGTWAATTVISGAVIAHGQAVVHGKPKLIQSLDGGIVATIAVQNGDHVSEGQLLLRLDPTLLAINLDIARGRLADALALKARLEAEQLGLTAPVFAYPDLPFPALDTATHEEGQRQIFVARAEVLQGYREQLAEKQRQFETQTQGIEAQITAKREQLGYLETDLENTVALYEKGLVRESEMLDLQRGQSELLGQISALDTELVTARDAMRDSELETLQNERAFKESVVTDLRDATAKTEELILEIVTRTEQLDRIEVRAPAAGIVHEMQVGTVGGVVAPGATILEIVPLNRGVDFELRVDPRAIDQVHPGQQAQVVMSSFDPRTTPKLVGEVIKVSPDAIVDPKTGQSYYRIDLVVSPEELARLEGATLVPGMPVEAFLETGDRSVLTYLLQPLSAHLRHAFREN